MRNLVKAGKLGHFKIGEDYRFTEADIAAYIDAHRTLPAPAKPEAQSGGVS